MIRYCWLAASLAMLLSGSGAQAQDWARKMFDRTSHSFGTVARGAKVETKFIVTNLYEEEVHISGVRSSCGCTTPQVLTSTLKTHEKGEILAQFQTRSNLGDKSATLTVTIDKPFFAEVQLQVSGYIRSDVVLDPGFVDLGTVDQGTATEKKISIAYAGRDTWQILDVLSVNKSLEAELLETSRGNGQVNYGLVVRLKSDAPVGYIRDQLTLVTNDQVSKKIPVDIEGRVAAELTVSPASLFMGVVQPGQKATKQLVVRGKKPFSIKSVKCDDASFTFKLPEKAGAVHLIPVTFTAGETTGKVTQKIVIETDLGTGVVSELNAFAEIVKAE